MRRRLAALFLFAALCAPAAGADTTGQVTASALVLRAGPGLAYEMIGELPQGAVLELLAYEDGWYLIRYGEETGYVHGRYVRVDLPEGAEATPSPEPPEALPAVTPPPGYASLPSLIFDGENNPSYPNVVKPGDMGNSVLDLQSTLLHLGYSTEVDGQFGYETQAALMRLQLALGLDSDGILGAQTRRAVGNSGTGGVELLDWWLGGNLSYTRLSAASLVDVRTGVRFRISRYGGDNHFDVEPLTAEDTRVFLSVVGGEWTWDRRPVWLEANGRVIAGSINCMPHEGQHIWNNDFNGHFCLHLYNSRTHDTDRVDEQHRDCVQEAWAARGEYSP